MEFERLWGLWLVGAGIGAVYGLSVAIGQLLSGKRKRKKKKKYDVTRRSPKSVTSSEIMFDGQEISEPHATKIPCSNCGALILTTTAERTGGVCMRCAKAKKRK